MSNGTAFPGLSDLANAIANAEGYGVSGAIPTIANNPGNIALGDLGLGSLGQNISVYPDTASGWNALNNQLTMIGNGQSRVYNPNMTLSQMAQAWAGGGQGSTNWLNNVSNSLGVDPSSTIGNILSGSPSTSTSGTGSTSTGGGLWQGLQDLLSGVGKYGGLVTPGLAGGAAEVVGGVPKQAADYVASLLFSSRLIMLVVGIILIAAGVLSFKQTQTVIKTVGKAAELAAV